MRPGDAFSTALMTDLYQLTMAYGYWKQGRADQQTVFHLFFRRAPFGGRAAIAAGLEPALRLLESFHFREEDLVCLSQICGTTQKPLFEPGFIEYLRHLRLSVDVAAVAEGTLVFPHEPLLRIQGTILQCQLLETALLNILNFQTLIATKAARIVRAAQGDSVLEFGLRRAQGPDGGLSASRAAFIGGCAATSNVLAGQQFGIPVKGTHAHSWVMAFDDELAAFEAYAAAMPDNCVFLVDTWDTLQGVRNAIAVGRQLRRNGHQMIGVRLDSGDLLELSLQARRLLDDAGFADAAIVASNDLDEFSIRDLKQRGAAINVWGVGTRLVTGDQQAALGGVYKLGAVRTESGEWQPKLKRSDQSVKTSIPGILQVRRYRDSSGMAVGDMIHNLMQPPTASAQIVGFDGQRLLVPTDTNGGWQDLLQPVMTNGRISEPLPSLTEIQHQTKQQLAEMPEQFLRLEAPEPFPAGIEETLFQTRTHLAQSHGKEST
ncbi:MAG: nicotinate phosphoribosyltransferase [Planctomycetaceae bacterium]|nr:nicotinate phosphoribosyltransferase [Planctomycetaceae bacterium]